MDKARSGTKVGMEALELCGEHLDMLSPVKKLVENERVMHGDLRLY